MAPASTPLWYFLFCNDKPQTDIIPPFNRSVNVKYSWWYFNNHRLTITQCRHTETFAMHNEKKNRSFFVAHSSVVVVVVGVEDCEQWTRKQCRTECNPLLTIQYWNPKRFVLHARTPIPRPVRPLTHTHTTHPFSTGLILNFILLRASRNRYKIKQKRRALTEP